MTSLHRSPSEGKPLFSEQIKLGVIFFLDAKSFF